MFNKKVLGTGLVALALSLGANAMDKGQQAKKETYQQQASKSSQWSDVGQGKPKVALPADQFPASQKGSACSDQTLPSQQSCSDQFPGSQKGSACSDQTLPSQQSCSDQFPGSQKASDCSDQTFSNQQDCASEQGQFGSDQCDSSQSFIEEAQWCGARFDGVQCSDWNSDNSLRKLIKNDKFQNIRAEHQRMRSNHALRWEKVKGRHFENDCLSDFGLKKFRNTTIRNVRFDGHMSKVIFGKDTKINDTTFQGTLNGVTFAGAEITKTSFAGVTFGRGGHAHTVSSSFQGAVLNDVSFRNAIFSEDISFAGAQFHGRVDFEGAQIQTRCNGVATMVTISRAMANRLHSDLHAITDAGFGLAHWVAERGQCAANTISGVVHTTLHSHHSDSSDSSDSDSDHEGRGSVKGNVIHRIQH